MQVKNDYDRDVFNGDIGRVLSVDAEAQRLLVDFNGQTILYQAEQLRQLSLAYCVSVHKSQGSEYPAIVLPLLPEHYLLLQRNLLYTAVTRAKQLVVIVGSQKALQIAVNTHGQSRRQTLLEQTLGSHAPTAPATEPTRRGMQKAA